MQPDSVTDLKVEKSLIDGLGELGISTSSEQIGKLITHVELLCKWNKAFNLTSIIDAQQILTHHLLDSASVSSWITGDDIIDVGTGAGFPGLTLAILQPERNFYLLDSRGKKTRFIDTVIRHTGINNAATIHNRVESFRPDTKFDTIVTRAFSSLHDMYTSCRHLMRPNGCIVAMKGEYPAQEIAVLKDLNLDIQVDEIHVPLLNAKRHAVSLRLP